MNNILDSSNKNNMQIKIRWSTKNDMVAVLELINELAIFENEPDAVVIDENYLIKHGFSEHPSFKCYVAEIDQQIVGIALFYERFSTWKGVTLHLEDLIVKQKFRKFGVGKALYNKFLEFAKNEKVNRVEWVVLDWNTNAIEFYEKSGAQILTDWRTVQMDDKALNKYLTK